MRNELKALPGLDQAFALGYPRLRRTTEAARRDGIVSHDLTGALDARPAGAEVYFDFCHVNHTANAALAQQICTRVFGDAAP